MARQTYQINGEKKKLKHNNKGHKSNQYNSDRKYRITIHPHNDCCMSKEPHMASDHSRVKRLSVSVRGWTGGPKPPEELEIAAV